jgi:uncharacterized protein YcbX
MPESVILSGLYLYPVKSLRGIPVAQATVRGGRLTGDREWVLVDDQGRFLHQRDYPGMARLGVQVDGGRVIIEAAGMPPLTLPDPASLAASQDLHVRLWRRAVPVIPVPEADGWFSRVLGFPCHLMAFAPAGRALDVPLPELSSALQDATPFHLTSEESLKDLNRRLAQPIPMIRFRPNLVVNGGAPYEEDDWRDFDVGGVPFTRIRDCTRCAITMTDHLTGARDRREPLWTLSTYRRLGSEVRFGHYVTAGVLEGQLRIGDEVKKTA